MDLNTLASLAEIIGAVIVVGGLWFAIVQLLHYRQQRRDLAAIELARSFQSPAFANALRKVLSMPDGVSAKEMRSMDPAYEDSAIQLAITLESVAIMIHRRVIDIDIVWELMGGVVMDSWEKLGVWVYDVRVEQEQEKFAEWFEWLDTLLKRHKVEGGYEPAFRLYGDWTP
jgi:hypothetical protein